MLIINDEMDCRIVDVTIASDLFDMAIGYEQKIKYYYNEEILRWAAMQWPGHLITVDAVVMNWRGDVCSRSTRLLKDLGIKESEIKIMSVRILTFTHSMLRHYTRGTTRTRTTR